MAGLLQTNPFNHFLFKSGFILELCLGSCSTGDVNSPEAFRLGSEHSLLTFVRRSSSSLRLFISVKNNSKLVTHLVENIWILG